MVSHDLMTPIKNISFFNDQIFHNVKLKDMKKVLTYQKLIQTSVFQAKSRMQDLQDQSHIEQSTFIPRLVQFSPIATVN